MQNYSLLHSEYRNAKTLQIQSVVEDDLLAGHVGHDLLNLTPAYKTRLHQTVFHTMILVRYVICWFEKKFHQLLAQKNQVDSTLSEQ